MRKAATLAVVAISVVWPAVRTGPAVGEKIPAFEAIDPSGQKQTFESLRGPRGLILVFIRSADW